MRIKSASQKGAAMVEFALILIPLLLITFGIIEFGMLMYNQQVLTNASREGARAGIVVRTPNPRLPATGANSIESVVQNYCLNNLVTFGATNIPPTTTVTYPSQNFGDPLKAGDIVPFNGGVTQQVVDALDALFKREATGTPPTWTTGVVVFEDFGICGNPNEKLKILGFATVKITGVILTGSNKGPQGEVQCNIAEQERGGCFYAGTYGVIPGLVQ